MHVLLLRLRYDGGWEEVIAATGMVAPGGVSAWSLRGSRLGFEYSPGTAAFLGFPRVHDLDLHLPPGRLALVRDALLEILASTCHVVDLPGFHHTA